MTHTTNLNLQKFENGDNADLVGVLDENWDALDAADSAVVHKTGDETIAGVKTFSSFPVTPSSAPATDYQTANKKYVDDTALTLSDQSLKSLVNSESPALSTGHIKTVTGSGSAAIPSNAKGEVDVTVQGVTTDGLSTYASQKITSVGKNLFDKSNLVLGKYEANGTITNNTTDVRCTNYIKVKPSTSYVLSKDGVAGNKRMLYYDKDKTFISAFVSTSAEITPANCEYIRFAYFSTTDISANIQLEPGTVATSHEDFVSSTMYVKALESGVVAELRSLSGGIYDEISNGVHTKRISNEGIALTTPVISDALVAGEIKAYPNGSITSEPCIFGFTNTATTTVTTAGYPVTGINKVIKYSVSDLGQLVETDVTANCTATTTALTIGSFTAGTYFYDCSISTVLTTVAGLSVNAEVNDGVVSHNFGATSTAWTLTTNESLAEYFICTNAGGAANIVAPGIDGKEYIIENNSSQTLTIKTSSTTGVTVATGKVATIRYNGSAFKKVAEV